jgi:hypothetical protein
MLAGDAMMSDAWTYAAQNYQYASCRTAANGVLPPEQSLVHPSIFSRLVIQPRTAHFMCARRCLCMYSGQDVQVYDVCMIYRLLHNVQAGVQFEFSLAESVGSRGRDKGYG